MACFLFASWLSPSTRALWDSLDHLIFFSFNGSFINSTFWQAFWAVTNWRPFDTIAASVVLFISFKWIYSLPTGQRLSALSGLALLLAIILVTRFTAELMLYLADYQRLSPTLVLSPAYRLSELVDWIYAKDYHRKCFPGDHGYVVISCIVFFYVQAGRRWGTLSLLLLSPFMLPRLFSGAHWATDILIGSATMALVSLPLLFATPLYHFGTRLSDRVMTGILRPVLRKMELL